MTIYTSDNTVQIYDGLTRVELNSLFQFYNELRTAIGQRVELLVPGLQLSRTTTQQSIEFLFPSLQSITETLGPHWGWSQGEHSSMTLRSPTIITETSNNTHVSIITFVFRKTRLYWTNTNRIIINNQRWITFMQSSNRTISQSHQLKHNTKKRTKKRCRDLQYHNDRMNQITQNSTTATTYGGCCNNSRNVRNRLA